MSKTSHKNVSYLLYILWTGCSSCSFYSGWVKADITHSQWCGVNLGRLIKFSLSWCEVVKAMSFVIDILIDRTHINGSEHCRQLWLPWLCLRLELEILLGAVELWSIGNNSQYYVVNMIPGCRVILLTTVYGFCLCRASGGNLHVVTAEAKQLGRRQTGLVFTPLSEPAPPACHHTEQPPCHFVQSHKENWTSWKLNNLVFWIIFLNEPWY